MEIYMFWFLWFFLGFLGTLGSIYGVERHDGEPNKESRFYYKNITIGDISLTILYLFLGSLGGFISFATGTLMAIITFFQYSKLGKKITNHKPFGDK